MKRRIAQLLIALFVVLAGVSLRRAVQAVVPPCAADGGVTCPSQMLGPSMLETFPVPATSNQPGSSSVAIGTSPVPLPPPKPSWVAISTSPDRCRRLPVSYKRAC